MISFSVPVRSPGRTGHSARSSGEPARGPGRFGGGPGPRVRTALAAWIAIILVGFAVGAVLRAAGYLPVDRFPPLHAAPRLLLGPLLPAAAGALIAVAVLPVAARRLPWAALLAVAWLGSALWAVLLQLPDGLARPLTTPTEYLVGLPAIGDHPLRWLRGFTQAMQAYPTHVKGHPPLPTLILWAVQHVGLRDAGWAAALVIAVGSSASAAIAITVRKLAGAETARRAVPFLVLAPTALWVATSVDALFLGVAAWAVALVTVATALGRWGALVSASAGGLLLGSLPYLSYGLLPMFALPLAVLLLTRPSRPVLAALAAGCVVVPAAFTVAGFSWFAGVVGTHAAWAAGGGARARPYAYFLLGDLSVLALLIGPATAMALPAVLRHAAALARSTFPGPADGEQVSRGIGRAAAVARSMLPGGPADRAEQASSRIGRLGWPVAAALIGMVALDLSGVTRGEVERIWIPYATWMTAASAVHRPPARTLLLAQAVTALAIQALVRSPW